MKLQNNEEKLKERKSAFVLNTGAATNNDNETSQIQVIKKANIFADQKYVDNLNYMIKQAQQVEIETQREAEQEKKRQILLRAQHEEKVANDKIMLEKKKEEEKKREEERVAKAARLADSDEQDEVL